MVQTTVVAQQKGGAGKPTITLNLWSRVAVADAQGSLTASADLLEGIQLISTSDALSRTAATNLVVIDTNTRNKAELSRVLAAADYVLIPVKPGYLDVLSLKDTQAILTEAGAKKAGIVLNMVQHLNALTKEVQKL